MRFYLFAIKSEKLLQNFPVDDSCILRKYGRRSSQRNKLLGHLDSNFDLGLSRAGTEMWCGDDFRMLNQLFGDLGLGRFLFVNLKKTNGRLCNDYRST